MSKHFIVTGAANGIGLRAAKAMLDLGHRVSVCDRDTDTLQHEYASYNPSCVHLVALDITKKQQWKSAINASIKQFGAIDYLFNIAGIVTPGFVQDIALKDIDDHIDINAKGNMYGAKMCADVMVKQGYGHIITVSSMAGLNPVSGLAAYTASKYAIRGFCLAMANDLKPLGVDVSVICPDLVKTAQFDLQLDYEQESALVFSGKQPLTVADLERAFIHVMKRKPLEYSLPFYRGLLCKLGDFFPTLNQTIERHMRKQGQARIQRARAEAKNNQNSEN